MEAPSTAPLSDRDLLARLVAFDSTSANSTDPIASFVCNYLDRPDIHVVRETDEHGKDNIIARIGPEPTSERDGLVLCGHMDVVPATEPQWESNPFELVERNDTLVARGACDMKGFDALAINALCSTDPATLRSPLVLVLTCNEEIGSLGARRLAQNWPCDFPLPTHAIIGEPTSLRAVRMHKGHLTARFEIHGRAAHSGSPHLGVNAIEPAAAIVQRLIALREQYERRRTAASEYFPQVPFTVVNIARIAGGDAINVVPEQCVIDVGIRLMPGESSDEAVDALQGIAGDDAKLTIRNDNPPMLLSDDAPVHRTLCDILGQQSSHGVSFASDAGWLSRMGVDCVLFGPGTIEVAHRPNEFVPIAELQRATEVISQLVDRICR